MKPFMLGIVFLLAAIESATAISCYVCNTTDSTTPFQCSEWFERFDRPDLKPVDCSNVYGAKYCIKHIGRFEDGIGAKRYCSSRDLGNYCNYVRNPGDQIEYRSCIFTCDTDGCNAAPRVPSISVSLLAAVALVVPLMQLVSTLLRQ
ncbi:U-scoloptoxin(05)-Sm1a [Anopheles moucheti]|uniref:U-scoloptoxin(05)-Sm1a n=1 Tax=Anopheles moucheti TaxID=186751 RepID=UPI0022F0AEA0|nr:U-scoloptoxin(05)-Sm1a [Anopheles moucheti]XP_052896762.1 U-scoloptoxin(05)-Sm1a [Anopheles moucheti]